MGDARAGLVRTLDLTVRGAAAVVVAGLVEAGRRSCRHPTSREAEIGRPAVTWSTPNGSLLPELGRRCPTSGWPGAAHGRPPPRTARRIFIPAPTPARTARRGRPARSLLRPGKGLKAEPVELHPATRRRWTTWSAGCDAAYTRVDLVEKRGEFAVGGIVDVSRRPRSTAPRGVLGDEVEETGRSRSRTSARSRRSSVSGRRRAASCADRRRRRRPGSGRHLRPRPGDRRGIAVEGRRRPGDEMELLVDLMPADTPCCADPDARGPGADLVATARPGARAAAAGGAPPHDPVPRVPGSLLVDGRGRR
jgi:hypothetical protein